MPGLGIIMWLVKLVSGLDLKGLIDEGVKAYAAKQDANVKLDTNAQQLATEAIHADTAAALANAEVVKAEQGNWLTRMARPAFALPFVAYIWKVVFWDNVLGLGTTHELSTDMKQIMIAVVVSYFGGRTIEKVASTVKGVVAGYRGKALPVDNPQ